MNKENFAGWYPSHVGGSQVNDHSINSYINKPLPWVALAFLLSLFCVFEATKATDRADEAKQAAFDSATQSLLLRDYVDRLRIEMASHGIKPPDYPQELKRP